MQRNGFFQPKDRKSAEPLEIELAKRKNLFPTVTLKFRKKVINRKFPFHATKRKYKIELETYCFFLPFLLVF